MKECYNNTILKLLKGDPLNFYESLDFEIAMGPLGLPIEPAFLVVIRPKLTSPKSLLLLGFIQQ